MPGNWRSAPRPQPPRILLTQAKNGDLSCTRDRDLNPTFHANVKINDADRQQILRWVLDGILEYERYERPHSFGVGQLRLTRRGHVVLLNLPGGVKVVTR
jgi:hypothetical protein